MQAATQYLHSVLQPELRKKDIRHKDGRIMKYKTSSSKSENTEDIKMAVENEEEDSDLTPLSSEEENEHYVPYDKST